MPIASLSAARGLERGWATTLFAVRCHTSLPTHTVHPECPDAASVYLRAQHSPRDFLMATNACVRLLPMGKGRVIVAMSGGVDSSVAALLLAREGYDVVGVTMRLWTVEREDVPRHSKQCCSVEDVDDARRVCQTIGVPHYVMNFEREFQSHVVDYFCREYDRGRTPHPCLACNDKIKFDFLLRRAMFLDADYIATGHYARIRPNGTGKKLLKGLDGGKDQSYVLFTLTQGELERLLLPVASTLRTAFAPSRRTRACRSPTSPTARISASSPTATTASSYLSGPGHAQAT